MSHSQAYFRSLEAPQGATLVFASDFHIECGHDVAALLRPAITPGQTILLAGGDIAVQGETVHALADLGDELGCPIIGIPGNHDYYGLDLSTADAQFRADAARYAHVAFLNNESLVLGDTHLWASCFWSDFGGDDMQAGYARLAFQRYVADSRAIRVPSTSSLRPFDYMSADDVVREHLAACASLEAWLDDCDRLDVPREKRVVMTHFTPTPALIQPIYENSPLNGYFVPDASRYFSRVGTWLCGHTHGPGEVVQNGCRVINGSLGYPGEVPSCQAVSLGQI